jgi:hypothetical protein
MADDAVGGIHREARTLAEEILADLELGRIPLTNAAMKCSRLARLMGNEKAFRWFQSEIGGYPTPPDNLSFDLGRAAGRTVSGTETDKDGPKIWTASIPSIESNLEALRIDLSSLNIPSLSLSEAEAQPSFFHIPGSSLTGIVTSVLTRRKEVLQGISTHTALLSGIRASIYRWVLETYHILRFGSIPASAFNSARTLVEAHLRVISADALEKFVAAQQRAISGASEEWSQALLSLRRMLKDLADTLYPAREGEIDGHAMDEEHYVNRLWQFVKERAAGDKAVILAADIQFLGQRVDGLYELSNKGTHAAVSREEVDLAVVHTYLLAADLISMLTPQERTQLIQP